MSLGKWSLVVGISALAVLARSIVAAEPETKPAAANAAPAQKTADGWGGVIKDAKPAEPGAAAVSEPVEKLIEQLDAADYDTRDKACTKLAAKGKEAVPALQKAAATGNLEVSSRATTILGRLLKSSDDATQKEAIKALKSLADGDSAAARKAKSIVESKDGLKNGQPGIAVPGGMGDIVIPGNNFGGGFGGRIIIRGGQLNIGGNGFAMKSMSVKNINGVKEIEVSEDGKRVKIVDDPGQGIKIEFTEKESGKESTKKYEAKNLEDLKKNSPAGYELYKKYGGEQTGNGAIQLSIQAGGIMGGQNLQFGNVIPAMPLRPAIPMLPLQPGQQLLPLRPVPATPAAPAPPGNGQQTRGGDLVKSLSARLEGLKQSEAYKNATPEAKVELNKQIDDLSKQLDEVRGQLGNK